TCLRLRSGEETSRPVPRRRRYSSSSWTPTPASPGTPPTSRRPPSPASRGTPLPRLRRVLPRLTTPRSRLRGDPRRRSPRPPLRRSPPRLPAPRGWFGGAPGRGGPPPRLRRVPPGLRGGGRPMPLVLIFFFLFLLVQSRLVAEVDVGILVFGDLVHAFIVF